jgi:hypothetical protein
MEKLRIVGSVREKNKQHLFSGARTTSIEMREGDLALICRVWLQGIYCLKTAAPVTDCVGPVGIL